jgi:hypothetical protein
VGKVPIELLPGGATTGPVWPELWVDDRDYERAVKVLLEGMTEGPVETARRDWTCPTCGESNPGNFAACWKCQGRTPRDFEMTAKILY